MVQIDFPCPKTWGQTPKSSLQHALKPSYNFGQFRPGQNSQNGHFGHSGQSGVSGNGLNRFPMPKNLGIDTKIKSLTCSEPKLQFRPFYPILMAKMAILATQVNLRCLEMVSISFLCPKTWGQTLKSSLQHALNSSYNFGQFRPGQNCPKWPFWPLRLIWGF